MAASRAEGEEPRRGGRAGGEEPRRGGRARGECALEGRSLGGGAGHAVCSGGKQCAFFVAALRLSPDAAHSCCRADRGRRRPAGAGAPRPLRRRPAPPTVAPPPSLPRCCTLPDRPCCRAAALSPFPDSGSATPPSKLRCRPFFSSTGAAPPALDSHPCPPRGGAAPLLAPDSLTCLLVRGSLPD